MATLALGLWLSRSKPTAPAGDVPLAADTNLVAAAGASPATDAAFAKLVGRWQRPDGGYVLALNSIDASGKIEAAYLNPSPIHVARAQALRKGSTNLVFVELRDVNYPGSTYTLTYDPASDQLYGIYNQAAMNQQFDVVFARIK